jgi:hypothetical protein
MAKPSEQEYKKLTWFLKRLSTSEDFCRPYFERAKRHYRLYRFGSAVDEGDWPYVNRVRTRDILAFVEDSTAIMVQTLFGSTPFYSVLPRYQSQMSLQYSGLNAMMIAQQVENFLDQQISNEETEFFEEITDFFKEGCIFGNSYMGVYPRFDAKGMYSGPMCKSIGYWDVLPITGARRITKARGVFVREFMSREEAMEFARKTGSPGSVAKLNGWNEGTERKWHSDLMNEVGITNFSPDADDIEVLHYFSGGHIVSIMDRAVIVRDSMEAIPNQLGEPKVIKPFPYDQPIVQYKYIPLPQEWFAMGIPEILECLQEDKNLVRSARRDNIDLVINKVLKARSGADINYDLIKYYAGAIWPLENLNDIEALETGDVTQSAYAEEGKIASDMENALSMFGYARGMTPEHEERPTTVIRLQQASLNRLDLSIKMAEFTVLQNIAQRIILLARRYMPQQMYEMIIGDKDAGLYRMSEDDIRKFYVIKPMGSSVTHVKEIRQQQIAQAMQLLMSVAPSGVGNVEPFQVNTYQAARAGLDALDIKNIDQLLVKIQPQQAQQMISQQQMKQMQMVKYGEDMKNESKAKYEVMKETAIHQAKTRDDVQAHAMKAQTDVSANAITTQHEIIKDRATQKPQGANT